MRMKCCNVISWAHIIHFSIVKYTINETILRMRRPFTTTPPHMCVAHCTCASLFSCQSTYTTTTRYDMRDACIILITYAYKYHGIRSYITLNTFAPLPARQVLPPPLDLPHTDRKIHIPILPSSRPLCLAALKFNSFERICARVCAMLRECVACACGIGARARAHCSADDEHANRQPCTM